MRKLFCVFLSLFALFGALFLPACSKKNTGNFFSPAPLTARFIINCEGDVVELSSGREATSENTIFAKITYDPGAKIAPPEAAPTRKGYVFAGWATSADGAELFDFSAPVYSSVNLYAKWARTQEQENIEDYTEPELSFKEIIDPSVPFALNGVLGSPVTEGTVKLTTAGIGRLLAHSDDVRTLLNYTRSESCSIAGAVYAEGKVSVSYSFGGDTHKIQVAVEDVTSSLKVTDNEGTSIDVSIFETKAKKYEAASFEPYNVILAGSSSIENWSDSSDKMAPVTTKNVGIGGSASYHWLNCYADRLIIPYSPRAVVLYVGINDIINYKRSGDKTAENLIHLFEHIHEALPETTVHYILINHVPGYYSSHKTAIDKANSRVIDYAKSHFYLKIIDAGTVLEKDSGKYSEAYFLKDGLHMSQAGYVLWGAEVRRAVIAEDKEKYGNKA